MQTKRNGWAASLPASQDLLLLLRLFLVLPADDTPSPAAPAAELSSATSELHGALTAPLLRSWRSRTAKSGLARLSQISVDNL